MHRFGSSALASLLGLVAAALPASGQSSFALSASPERGLARAADSDGSGDVSAEERATFVASFTPAADGTLDRRGAAARIVRGSLDTDGDGLLTGQDATARLANLDADGSGTLEPAELAASIASSGRARGLIFDGIVGYGADLDGNGTVDGDEWRAAATPAEEEIDGPQLLVWVTGAERGQDDDINSFGPATLLATLRGAMDANRDGAFRLDDVEQVFADLDTNGDGAVSAGELALPRRNRFGGGESEGPAGATPLIPWQRTLEDALALVAATGKPLLVCVNMDGEAASEALARRRYRDPEFAKLAGGFIPVLASPNRHNPRDYDDDGRRIPDPRFGRLIDSEHIDIEPVVFERYFRGERVAPRHVGVSAAGEILFDLYLLQDLRIVDRTLERHGVFDVALPDPATLDEAALLTSPDAAARDRLEGLFLEASAADQVRLLGLAFLPARPVQHPSLLRMGLRSSRLTVRQKALEQYVARAAVAPTDLYPELLRVARDFPELEPALRAQLAARADSDEGNDRIRARRLSRVFEAAGQPSSVLDVELWKLALAGAPAVTAGEEEDLEPVYEALARLDERVKATPDDARLNTLFAQLALRGAQGLIARGTGNPSFLLQDAQAAAQRAVDADPSSSLAWAYLASSSFLSSDFDTAGDAAAKALPALVDQAGSRLAADVLVALASSRTRSLYPVLGGDEEWPAGWVSEILGAYEVLLAHPLGTEAHARGGLGVMTSLEVFSLQGDFLRRALGRFPASGDLHNYYRWQVLRDEGAAGLLVAYDDLAFGEAFVPTQRWFEGLADFVAAERLVRDRHPERALAAYQKSIEDFEASMELEESFGESASHYVALAWSGIARLHLDSGQLDEAVTALHESAQAGPSSFTSRDGLENTPSGTARELMTALKRAKRGPAADALSEFLDSRGVSL